jgi:hypothetical protein
LSLVSLPTVQLKAGNSQLMAINHLNTVYTSFTNKNCKPEGR